MATLEDELRSVIPLDRFVELSSVPALYLEQFGRKLVLPFKLSKFMGTSMSHAFEVDDSKQYINNKVSYLRVKQLPAQRLVSRMSTTTNPAHVAHTVVPQSPMPIRPVKQRTPKSAKFKDILNKDSSQYSLELNERGDVAVSLSQLTASLHNSKSVVPLGGLAAFICAKKAATLAKNSAPLIAEEQIGHRAAAGSCILGFSINVDSLTGSNDKAVYINTTDPFCAVCIGVQGAGKSHTMNVILENCMMNKVSTVKCSIVSSPQSMCGLVLHYDQSESNCCEAVGLNSPAAPLSLFPGLKVQRLVVLASPTYYLQRKAFYGDTCEVIPLLFDWDTLTATQLKKLMRLSDSDAQLYVSVILNKLREYQRKNKIPSFDGFLDEVMALCNVQGQNAPLQQRLELLKTVVRESAPNEDLREHSHSLASLMQAGTLVVADLTDPMMSADEACGVFQVLLEQFRGHPLGDVGKVVTFDEAHKYLNKSGPGCVELSNAIVDTVRLMRHEGIRVLISTQSPLTMPPELLELTSVTILHKFQSADWAKYLGSKVTLPPDGFHEIQSLEQGQALLLSTQIGASERDSVVVNHLKVNIRPRLTLDLGASRRNRSGADDISEEDSVTESSGHDSEEAEDCADEDADSESQSHSQSQSQSDAGSGEEQGTRSQYKDSYEDTDTDYGSIKDSDEESEESQSLWRNREANSADVVTYSSHTHGISTGGERNYTNSARSLGTSFKELDISDW